MNIVERPSWLAVLVGIICAWQTPALAQPSSAEAWSDATVVEGATRVRSEPALAAGAIYLGSQDGRVYALDRKTGCQRWQFAARSEVRTGVIVSSWRAGDTTA